MERTAEEKFNLELVAEVSVDGQSWVVYSDDLYTWAIVEEDWYAPVPSGMDYSDWCSRTDAVGDHNLCRKIAREADVGINAAGDCALITP